VQIRHFKSVPHVCRSAPHILSASPRRYSCRSGGFRAAPTAPHTENSPADPRAYKYPVNICADPQFQICPACPAPQIRPAGTRQYCYRSALSSFYSSPTALALLTYYRSAPHLHLHLDLPHRSAPPRKFNQPPVYSVVYMGYLAAVGLPGQCEGSS